MFFVVRVARCQFCKTKVTIYVARSIKADIWQQNDLAVQFILLTKFDLYKPAL